MHFYLRGGKLSTREWKDSPLTLEHQLRAKTEIGKKLSLITITNFSDEFEQIFGEKTLPLAVESAKDGSLLRGIYDEKGLKLWCQNGSRQRSNPGVFSEEAKLSLV
ncbi:hypothetical protein NE237_005887 [Protea cynaroides]|uniref:Uncharacterized protein n=1 Tax=Protea cynaroides TaxID=273540 RepID=A0A9Q0KLC5_9MAGN|nr:hypothetical protein NE237_005887 [Protea cynaroides]